MISLSAKVNKKFAWGLNIFHKIREFKDGIDFFDFECTLDLYEGDHNPQFRFFLEVLNFTIIEFEFYNMFHKD